VKTLIQLSLLTPADAEEMLGLLFDQVCQQTPSIYTDAETGVSTASVYLAKPLPPAHKRALNNGLAKLRQKFPALGRLVQKKVRRENWAESWKRHFKPMEIGSALLIKPSWSKKKPRKGQAVVILDPGLSFGTGQHATTSFCLQQIVACRDQQKQQAMLDIGTGSGILSIAGVKLGYTLVEAFDFDPESIRVARENARKNKAERNLHLFQQDLTKLPVRPKQRFDVVCANLIYDLLIAEAGRITARVKPDGHLILAGILITQFAKVEAAYKKVGFTLVTSRCEKEWQSGYFRRTE
jgi:ribosomal protein L11 methyltransferase